LLISEELEELLALADRILVMYEGRVTASFDTPRASDVEAIGLHMTGGEESADRAPNAPEDGTA
jgi:simple sugar transport system ATP-binding protein